MPFEIYDDIARFHEANSPALRELFEELCTLATAKTEIFFEPQFDELQLTPQQQQQQHDDIIASTREQLRALPLSSVPQNNGFSLPDSSHIAPLDITNINNSGYFQNTSHSFSNPAINYNGQPIPPLANKGLFSSSLRSAVSNVNTTTSSSSSGSIPTNTMLTKRTPGNSPKPTPRPASENSSASSSLSATPRSARSTAISPRSIHKITLHYTRFVEYLFQEIKDNAAPNAQDPPSISITTSQLSEGNTITVPNVYTSYMPQQNASSNTSSVSPLSSCKTTSSETDSTADGDDDVSVAGEDIQATFQASAILTQRHHFTLTKDVHDKMRDPKVGFPRREYKSLKSRKVYKNCTSGKEIVEWCMANLPGGCLSRKQACAFAEMLFNDGLIRPVNRKKDRRFIDSDERLYRLTQHVVILGGGFAGSHIARTLESDFRVTLVDPKPFFECIISLPTLFSDPAYIDTIRSPHYQYLRSAKLVIGKAVEITNNQVVVELTDDCFDEDSIDENNNDQNSDSNLELATFLRKPAGRVVIRDLCKKELCVENINFWEKVELDWKVNAPRLSNFERRQLAINIYNQYIPPSSPEPLNINQGTIQRIHDILYTAEAEDGVVPLDVFDNAKLAIEYLMQDMFRRWKAQQEEKREEKPAGAKSDASRRKSIQVPPLPHFRTRSRKLSSFATSTPQSPATPDMFEGVLLSSTSLSQPSSLNSSLPTSPTSSSQSSPSLYFNDNNGTTHGTLFIPPTLTLERAVQTSILPPGTATTTTTSNSSSSSSSSSNRMTSPPASLPVSRRGSQENLNSVRRRITTLEYDYLVVCTGSHYEMSNINKVNRADVPIIDCTSSQQILENYDKIEEAHSITVIGGGPVGIEIAGELLMKFPDKLISLVARGDLLERCCASAHKNVLKYFNSFPNMKVYFKDTLREIIQEGGAVFVETEAGNKIKSDVILGCIGFTPNTQCFEPHFSHVLDPHNQVKVNSFMQVGNMKNVFAAGDIVDIKEEKLAQNAKLHAEVIIANIRRLSQNQNPNNNNNNNVELVEYKPGERVLIVSLGPKKAVMIKNDKVLFESAIVSKVKNLIEYNEMRKVTK